jgi:cytochrome c nitrite reductase small subunit
VPSEADVAGNDGSEAKSPPPSRPSRAPLSGAGLVLATMIGVAIGLSLFTFDYAEGTSYLSNDPTACINCHIMREQFDGWQKSAHHAVATCNDCHTPHDFFGKYYTKAEHGFRHSKGFTFNDFHEPIQMKRSSYDIVNHNCISCHEPLVAEIGAHGLGAGSEPIDCLRCHASAAHGPTK